MRTSCSMKTRRGASIVELLVGLAIVGVIIGFALPSVQWVGNYLSGHGAMQKVWVYAEEASQSADHNRRPVIRYQRVQGSSKEYLITTAPFGGRQEIALHPQYRVIHGNGHVMLPVPLRYFTQNAHMQRQALDTAVTEYFDNREDLEIVKRHDPYVHVATDGGENHLIGVLIDVNSVGEVPWLAEKRQTKADRNNNDAPAPNGTQYVSFSENDGMIHLDSGSSSDQADPTGGLPTTKFRQSLSTPTGLRRCFNSIRFPGELILMMSNKAHRRPSFAAIP